MAQKLEKSVKRTLCLKFSPKNLYFIRNSKKKIIFKIKGPVLVLCNSVIRQVFPF